MTLTGILRVPLSELRTNDEQVIGSVYEVKNKTYRYVKNAGSTALIAKACCMEMLTSVEAGMKTRVIAPDGIGNGTTTAFVGLPAGMPMSAIGASGSGTGAYGWVQAKGPAKVTLLQLTTALTVGEFAIGSNVHPTTQPWASTFLPTADSASVSNLYDRGVRLMQAVASTGAATSISCLVDIQCLA